MTKASKANEKSSSDTAALALCYTGKIASDDLCEWVTKSIKNQ